jgi:predicted nucleic acid-binding Zn ribbon protein
MESFTKHGKTLVPINQRKKIHSPMFIAQEAFMSHGGKPGRLLIGKKERQENEVVKSRRNKEAEHIKSILELVINENKLSGFVDAGVIKERWSSIVGDKIAAKTHIANYQDGVLEIVADSSSWAKALIAIKGKILEQIRNSGIHGIEELNVMLPKGPRFKSGRKHITLRGERDTWV